MIGTTEIIIIVAVVLVLFGAAAIPKFARSLGRAKKIKTSLKYPTLLRQIDFAKIQVDLS